MARVSRKGEAAATVQPTELIRYKTAIYTRLSDEDMRKKISNSIGTQKSMLLRFLQTQPDLELCKVYEDVNYTGTNFKRPAFNRMIEDIQAGLINCVLVKDLSRFGRSFEQTGNYLERVFPFLGVRFISVSDNYDSLTASLDESSLIVPLKNLMNEVYARDISRKVQSSLKLKQKRGEFCGPFAPYGYLKKGSVFIVDQKTAPVVLQIFRWVLEGWSDIAITHKLNDLNILPPGRYRFENGISKADKYKEAQFWYKSAVKRIAENPAYTGRMVQGKYKSNFLYGGGTVHIDRNEWVVVEGAHPAIIDEDLFEAVREIREARRKQYKANEIYIPQDHIFGGLIVCGDCKARMIRKKTHRRTGNNEGYFLCGTYEQVDKNACIRKKIMEVEIQTALVAYISCEISLVMNLCSFFTELQKCGHCILDRQIEMLEMKLKKNRQCRGSLREDYIDGILSQQDYAMMRAVYDEERDSFQSTLNALLAEKHVHNNFLSAENQWITEFRRFETEKSLSGQMAHALIERIEVYDGKRIEVTLRYRDEIQSLRQYIKTVEVGKEDSK